MASLHHDYIPGRNRWLPGDLTKASMLYEGAFDEWWSHLQAVWRVRNNHSRRYLWLELDLLSFRFSPREFPETYTSVNPNLTRRVPDAAFQSVATLIPALKIASQPFRLMDLPTEVRLRVFEYVPLDLHCEVDNGHEFSRSDVPALIACSRQVRRETLPLVGMTLEITSFANMFDGGANSTCDAFKKQFRLWSLSNGSRIVKEMSRLTISYSADCDYYAEAQFELEFILNSGKGLVQQRCPHFCETSEGGDYLTQEMLQEVGTQVADLEVQRRAQGMHGEVFVLLITDAFEKWAFLCPKG
jgi:hypothetical protein